jgi:hypothetical protein
MKLKNNIIDFLNITFITNNFYIKKKILIYLILLNFFIFGNFNKFLKRNHKISLVVPIISRDFHKIYNNLRFYINFIDGIKNIIFIGNEEINKLIKEKKYSLSFPIIFINEKLLIDADKIKQLIKIKNKYAVRRSGWYIQQFLKMIYCRLCHNKFYLIWDSDTIPIKKVKMFNNVGKPIFDVKREYHKPYFITLKKIFPELGKKYNYSFISEHMIINAKLMKNMIKRISFNKNLIGNTWYEKIINCIDIKYLQGSGFSEFETYGTFVKEYYKQIYDIRHWKSLRLNNGNKILHFNSNILSDIKNISKNYNAISFEQ